MIIPRIIECHIGIFPFTGNMGGNRFRSNHQTRIGEFLSWASVDTDRKCRIAICTEYQKDIILTNSSIRLIKTDLLLTDGIHGRDNCAT
ncbi:hypothetical protein TFUB22_01313 [Tannerella forsythia]|nr:hypothetical protein TFUB22_01313 [Tannerella forsythia]